LLIKNLSKNQAQAAYLCPYFDNFYISQFRRDIKLIIGKTVKPAGYLIEGKLSKEINAFTLALQQ
jgi:hypothetical protein